MINYIARRYSENYSIMQAGTGDSPLTVPYYIKCGFTESHRIKNFFRDNYDRPIIECGATLCDMVYFRKIIGWIYDKKLFRMKSSVKKKSVDLII